LKTTALHDILAGAKIVQASETDAQYRRHGLGSTAVKDFICRGPRYAYNVHVGGDWKKDFPWFAFGRAFHVYALLGRAEFEKGFLVLPPGPAGDKRRKEVKLKIKCARAEGMEVLGADDFSTIQAMAASAARFLDPLEGRHEAEVAIRTPAIFPSDIHIQGRMDLLLRGDPPTIVDLKTTTSLGAVRKGFWGAYRYDLQAGLYTALAEVALGQPVQFRWLAVEKDRPYRCEWLGIDEPSLRAAQNEIALAIPEMAQVFNEGMDSAGQLNGDDPTQHETLTRPPWCRPFRGWLKREK